MVAEFYRIKQTDSWFCRRADQSRRCQHGKNFHVPHPLEKNFTECLLAESVVIAGEIVDVQSERACEQIGITALQSPSNNRNITRDPLAPLFGHWPPVTGRTKNNETAGFGNAPDLSQRFPEK